MRVWSEKSRFSWALIIMPTCCCKLEVGDGTWDDSGQGISQGEVCGGAWNKKIKTFF